MMITTMMRPWVLSLLMVGLNLDNGWFSKSIGNGSRISFVSAESTIPRTLESVFAAIERRVPIPDVDVDCDPCIDRSKVKLRAIFHGSKIDPFWQQMSAAMEQSAKDLGVSVEITLYDIFDPQAMVTDIAAVAASSNPPDALIVSIPSDDVGQAVRKAVDAGIPVFGCNSGYKLATPAGVLTFVAQDEYIAGQEAANEIIRVTGGNLRNALFINHEKGNSGIEDRLLGFESTILNQTGVELEELIVDGVLDDQTLAEDIKPVFTGCPYHVVVLASARAIDIALAAFDGLFADCTGRTLLATFDTARIVYAGILQRKIAVGVSQQPYLQAVLPVLFATQFVTTKQLPNLSSQGDFGILLSGPSVINRANVPTDTLQICADDAYPVCPNTLKVDGSGETSECPCTDRTNIRIGGVLHGLATDPFWSQVFAAAEAAASDLNIDLRLEQIEAQDDGFDVDYNKMTEELNFLCNEDYDGVFISIPPGLPESHPLIDAIDWCQALRIPTISIVSGATLSADHQLLEHIGQVESRAGYQAGVNFIDLGVDKVWCLEQGETTLTSSERCNGLEQALLDGGAEYMGIINVSDEATLQELVESVVVPFQATKDWDGIGLLLLSPTQVDAAQFIFDDHPEVKIGVFDKTEGVQLALEAGSVAFIIDQQAYLQGYLAVALLTYYEYTKHNLADKVIETGPISITTPASEQELICEANEFEVCERTVPKGNDSTSSATPKTIKRSVYFTIIFVIVGLFLIAGAYVAYSRKRKSADADLDDNEQPNTRTSAMRKEQASESFRSSDERGAQRRISGQLSGRLGSKHLHGSGQSLDYQE